MSRALFVAILVSQYQPLDAGRQTGWDFTEQTVQGYLRAAGLSWVVVIAGEGTAGAAAQPAAALLQGAAGRGGPMAGFEPVTDGAEQPAQGGGADGE